MKTSFKSKKLMYVLGSMLLSALLIGSMTISGCGKAAEQVSGGAGGGGGSGNVTDQNSQILLDGMASVVASHLTKLGIPADSFTTVAQKSTLSPQSNSNLTPLAIFPADVADEIKVNVSQLATGEARKTVDGNANLIMPTSITFKDTVANPGGGICVAKYSIKKGNKVLSYPSLILPENGQAKPICSPAAAVIVDIFQNDPDMKALSKSVDPKIFSDVTTILIKQLVANGVLKNETESAIDIDPIAEIGVDTVDETTGLTTTFSAKVNESTSGNEETAQIIDSATTASQADTAAKVDYSNLSETEKESLRNLTTIFLKIGGMTNIAPEAIDTIAYFKETKTLKEVLSLVAFADGQIRDTSGWDAEIINDITKNKIPELEKMVATFKEQGFGKGYERAQMGGMSIADAMALLNSMKKINLTTETKTPAYIWPAMISIIPELKKVEIDFDKTLAKLNIGLEKFFDENAEVYLHGDWHETRFADISGGTVDKFKEILAVYGGAYIDGPKSNDVKVVKMKFGAQTFNMIEYDLNYIKAKGFKLSDKLFVASPTGELDEWQVREWGLDPSKDREKIIITKVDTAGGLSEAIKNNSLEVTFEAYGEAGNLLASSVNNHPIGGFDDLGKGEPPVKVEWINPAPLSPTSPISILPVGLVKFNAKLTVNKDALSGMKHYDGSTISENDVYATCKIEKMPDDPSKGQFPQFVYETPKGTKVSAGFLSFEYTFTSAGMYGASIEVEAEENNVKTIVGGDYVSYYVGASSGIDSIKSWLPTGGGEGEYKDFSVNKFIEKMDDNKTTEIRITAINVVPGTKNIRAGYTLFPDQRFNRNYKEEVVSTGLSVSGTTATGTLRLTPADRNKIQGMSGGSFGVYVDETGDGKLNEVAPGSGVSEMFIHPTDRSYEFSGPSIKEVDFRTQTRTEITQFELDLDKTFGKDYFQNVKMDFEKMENFESKWVDPFAGKMEIFSITPTYGIIVGGSPTPIKISGNNLAVKAQPDIFLVGSDEKEYKALYSPIGQGSNTEGSFSINSVADLKVGKYKVRVKEFGTETVLTTSNQYIEIKEIKAAKQPPSGGTGTPPPSGQTPPPSGQTPPPSGGTGTPPPPPPPTTYTLTMAVSGTGTTTPPVGNSTHASGAVVPIVATPGTGFVFGSWTGQVANPTSASTTVTMNASKTVTANFITAPPLAPTTFTLTMAVSGTGTTTPAVGNSTQNAGAIVNILATPAAGNVFVNWTGEVANPTSASTTVTMNASKTVTANFQAAPPTTHSISGTVSGLTPSAASGVYLYTQAPGPGVNPFAGLNKNAGETTYTFPDLANGTYYVQASQELNGSSGITAGDKSGDYQDSVPPSEAVIVNGANVNNINFNVSLLLPSISGTLTGPGPDIVMLFNALPTGQPPTAQLLNQSGSYIFNNLQNGTYYVRAFQDLNNNGTRENGEPRTTDWTNPPANVVDGNSNLTRNLTIQ
jgi:uncharacterized protein (DUF2141 family)